MANFIPSNIPAKLNGWHKWLYVKSTINSIQLPDASFPITYTPAKSFWAESIIDNCLIPWIVPLDPFSAFLLGGGTSGTLIGSLGGLAVIKTLSSIPSAQIFGYGRSAPAPSMAFCIGNKIHHQAYTRLDVQNEEGIGAIATNYNVELIQNSRFKRFYVNHGEVTKYTNASSEHILTLDINSTNPPSGLSGGDVIMLTNSAGATTSVAIQSVKNNWDIVIDNPGTFNPEAGNFYKINGAWCIEDPFLLSGKWRGSELDSTSPSSGLNLYKTTHQSPYEEGKFLGVYIFLKPESGPSSFAALDSQPISGSSMMDNNTSSWAYFSFGNESDGQIYPDVTRYKEVITSVANTSGSIITYVPRAKASLYHYNILLTGNSSSTAITIEPPLSTLYIRTEISKGGYSNRRNWYSPCLKGSYINVSGATFKILGHIDANIIDVAIESVDGRTVFDPYKNQSYSILNQYGWTISEHYNSMPSQAGQGIFQGHITTTSFNAVLNETNIIISSNGDQFISWVIDSGYSPPDITNNFISRYKKTHIRQSGEPRQGYKKFQGWKLVVAGINKEISIKDVSFNDENVTSYGQPYSIGITVSGNLESIINSDAYISFDDTFSTIGSFSKSNGETYILAVSGGLSSSNKNQFIVSDQLCLNGSYMPPPYSIDIPPEAMIGMCEGIYFGIEINGSAQSPIGQLMFVTTQESGRGIASLFHALAEEDWVVYRDFETGLLTIRRGYLDFKELPQKSEVSIGFPSSIESVDMIGNKITLNSLKERLKRLKVKVGQALGSDISYIFYIDANSKDNTYGILVSGDGKVDLQELRRQGIEEGNTASDYWTYNGEDVSPAYIYKKSDYQNLDELMVDIGVSTDKAIYSSGGLLSDIVAQYVNNNQTIPADGFFDVHRLSDGEILLLYSSTIGEIKITGESGTSFIRNSPTNGTEWVNSKSAVMMIGTNNDSLEWKTPFAPKDNLTPEITYQYPLMILNGVDFLASVYNRINETMTVFAKCYDESNRSFIGCLIFNLTTLLYKNFKCTDKNYNPSSPEQTSLSFLYRVPLLAVDFFTDSNKRWTSYNNILPTEWGYVPAIDKVPADSFVRIIGGTGTSSQISYDGDIGIISTHMLENGTIIMFYDIISGIKAAFSSDGGEHWFSPNIIYAREASSAFLMGWYLYYITTDGIRMKKTDPYDFYSGNEIAVKKAAGIDVSSEELNIQSKLDKEETLLIGSGVINSQRLSGYVSPSGIIKLFFYNDKGLLKSMESTNTFTWNVTDNF